MPPIEKTVATSPSDGISKMSWADVAKHNTSKSAHVAIRGKVYDVTDFLERHPGGKDVLLCAIGRDATQVFETYHPLKTKEVLSKYLVGDLIDCEPCCPTFSEPGPFFTTVKQRVEEYFQKTKQDPKNPAWMWLRYFNILAVLISCWYLHIFVFQNIVVQSLLSLILGFCAALIGLMPMHDASHFSITHKPWVWRSLGAIHDFFNGASFLCWIYQHALGHHPYTNIDNADPDVQTSEQDIRRIKATQKWSKLYIPQHIYVPILYALLSMKTRLQDVTILTSRMNGVVRVNPPTNSHLAVFILGKSFFVFYRIIVPIWAGMSPSRVFLHLCLADAVTSYWLALTFQANHVVEEVAWPAPDADNKINNDWGIHQVTTTQDYAHHSWGWNVFSGALNHQTTHHLFPWVNQYYYPEISPIVQKTCKEFGIKYYYKQTFLEALGSHIGHMKNLGADAPERKKKQK